MHLDDLWRRRYLRLAEEVASWSKDPSTGCGAVIVRPDKTIASIGFNGFPRRVLDDERLDDRDSKLALMVHAEMNAILNARERDLEGYAMVVWPFPPCARCAVHIIQAGIRLVVAPFDIPSRWLGSMEQARQVFEEAGVELVFHGGAIQE